MPRPLVQLPAGSTHVPEAGTRLANAWKVLGENAADVYGRADTLAPVDAPIQGMLDERIKAGGGVSK